MLELPLVLSRFLYGEFSAFAAAFVNHANGRVLSKKHCYMYYILENLELSL